MNNLEVKGIRLILVEQIIYDINLDTNVSATPWITGSCKLTDVWNGNINLESHLDHRIHVGYLEETSRQKDQYFIKGSEVQYEKHVAGE